MSERIDGTFSLADMVRLTYATKYKSRFEYAKRDLVKKIIITKQIELNPDGKDRPNMSIIIETKSYPQYTPYNNHIKKGKQRKHHHEYDNYLSIVTGEDGKFSMNSTKWKYRLGSQKKWVDKPPQSKVKTIYKETREKWKAQYDKEVLKIKSKYLKKITVKDREQKKKELAKAKLSFEKRIETHRKQARYLDVGDYNSQVNGINGDAVWRMHPILFYYGHLFGRNTEKTIADTSNPFLCKHTISLITSLCKIGVLSKE